MRKALLVLGQFTDLDVEWMITAGRAEQVRAGTRLVQQGRPLSSLYLVLSGDFSVVDEKLGDKELARLGSGEILGEMSFIDSRPPSATVTARSDGIVLALRRTEVTDHLASDHAFAARFYRAIAMLLSDRLRATVGTLGYGPTNSISDEEQPDELDLNVLDAVHLAGARFDHIVKRLGVEVPVGA